MDHSLSDTKTSHPFLTFSPEAQLDIAVIYQDQGKLLQVLLGPAHYQGWQHGAFHGLLVLQLLKLHHAAYETLILPILKNQIELIEQYSKSTSMVPVEGEALLARLLTDMKKILHQHLPRLEGLANASNDARTYFIFQSDYWP